MKILFLNHLPLVGSGSGVYTTNLAKSLILLGHEVCSIMPENETKNVYDETFKGIKMHPVYFKNEEEIDGQLDFNFPCFTSHPRSSFNFLIRLGETFNILFSISSIILIALFLSLLVNLLINFFISSSL